MAEPNWKGPFHVEYDPRLVEETVLLRIRRDPEEKRFYRARDLIYELGDAEEREKRFQEFHAEWFLRLQLGQPVRESLTEQSGVLQKSEERRVGKECRL